MREGVCADHRLVGLHGIAGNGGHQFRCRHDLRGVDARFQAKQIVAYFQRHHNFFQAGIARAFAQTVDGAFHLAHACLNGSQRVGNRHAQVVVAVCGPDDLIAVGHAFDDVADTLVPHGRDGVADGIGNIDGGRARFNHRRKNFSQKVQIGTNRVFGGKFHIIRIFFGDFHRFHRRINHLLRLHFQLVFHVDGAGGDEGVDALFRRGGNGFARLADIVFNGTRQRADGGVSDDFGNRVHRFEIARAGGGKARFNHVHAHFFQLAGNTDFLFFSHGCAGRLFAVAHSGVEYDDAVVLAGGHGIFLQGGLLLHKGVQIQRPPLGFGQRGQLLQLRQRQRAARAPFVDGGRAGGILRVLLLQGFGQSVYTAEIGN